MYALNTYGKQSRGVAAYSCVTACHCLEQYSSTSYTPRTLCSRSPAAIHAACVCVLEEEHMALSTNVQPMRSSASHWLPLLTPTALRPCSPCVATPTAALAAAGCKGAGLLADAALPHPPYLPQAPTPGP